MTATRASRYGVVAATAFDKSALQAFVWVAGEFGRFRRQARVASQCRAGRLSRRGATRAWADRPRWAGSSCGAPPADSGLTPSMRRRWWKRVIALRQRPATGRSRPDGKKRWCPPATCQHTGLAPSP